VEPVLLASALVVDFGEVRAVDGFDLSVGSGASVALVGRNGAGKSTTMRVLAGVLPATAGTVTVGGIEAARDPAGVRALVGYCPDVGGLVPRATPWEHLQLAARLRGMTDWQGRARDLLERFDLTGAFDGVAPLGVDATLFVVREALANGAAVLLSTHLLHLAVEACQEAVVLRGGRVVGAAPAVELTGDAGRDRYRALIT